METFIKLSQQKKYLESLGYKVLYIGLFGSQNYSLNDEHSDIDSRAIVLPNLEQLIKKEMISKKVCSEFGEIDVKDVLTFYEVIRKGNFAFIEPMQTKWFIGDKYLRELFGSIPVNLRSLKGDMYNKAESFRKPFAGKTAEIDKWGYDPKQMHHLIRLMYLLYSRDVTKAFIDYADDVTMRNWLISIKRNTNNIIDTSISKLIDISTVETMKSWINEKAKDYIPNDYDYKEVDLLDKVVEYMKRLIKMEASKSEFSYVRQVRTFDQPIPKSDLKKFEKLRELDGQDVSYIVYESIDIL